MRIQGLHRVVAYLYDVVMFDLDPAVHVLYLTSLFSAKALTLLYLRIQGYIVATDAGFFSDTIPQLAPTKTPTKGTL